MANPIALEQPDAFRHRGRLGVRVAVGMSSLGVVAVAGYTAFLVFATSGSVLTPFGYLLVAIVAGAGSFFSPCSFPLLPSYFAYAQVARPEGEGHGRARALADGLAAAAGVISFNAILGIALGIVGLGVAQTLVLLSPNPSWITLGLRSAVGAALLGLGAVQIANVSFHGGLLNRIARFLQPDAAPRDPLLRLFLYGFAYTVIGIGCAAPFLATVIVLSLAAGGILPALAGFLAFSLTMAVLMVFVSIFAASSRRRLLRDLSVRTPAIKRAGGVVLAAFGTVLVVLTVWPGLLAPLFP